MHFPVRLSGGASHHQPLCFAHALCFQTRLDAYMRNRFLPITTARTVGSHMFWKVRPMDLKARTVAKYVGRVHNISVEVTDHSNSLLIYPSVADFCEIEEALEKIALILDPPTLHGDLTLCKFGYGGEQRLSN